MYYIISCSEDGDVRVEELESQDVEDYINAEPGDGVDPKRAMAFLEGGDPMEWGGKYLIIKGVIVKPKAVERITKYEIE